MPLSDDIERHRTYWEQQAARDPLWAILSDPARKNRQWNVEDFFQTGRREISLLMYRLGHLGIDVARGQAFDFGCGVGRLTQALADYFQHVVGVDLSATMVRLAEQLNRHGERVQYRTNTSDNLALFGDDTFDFVYSNIVLQHLEPALSVKYVQEFIRVARAGGVVVFQLPSDVRPADRRSTAQPMPEDGYRARLDLAPHARHADPGSEVHLRGLVTNTSSRVWSGAEFGTFRVGNHWLDASGRTMLVQDDARYRLPSTVKPGDTVPFELAAHVPQAPGDYACEVDVVHEGVSWFADKGSSPARTTVGTGADAAVADREPRAAGSRDPAPPIPHRDDREPADVYRDLPPDVPDPGDFPMHGVTRDVVLSHVRDAGGEVLAVEEDERGGPDWVGYFYTVRKTTRGLGT